MRIMKINKTFILLSIVSLLLSSCNTSSFLVRSDRDTELLKQMSNSLDPRGTGTIDPKTVTTVSEKGLTKFYFNQGESEITFKIKPVIGNLSLKAVDTCTSASCISNDPDITKLLSSPELKNFKEVKGEITVDTQTVNFTADINNLLPDLSQSLQLLGLAKNSQVTIKGTAYDINGNVMGSKEYKKTITEKVDTVELEILIGKIQTNAK